MTDEAILALGERIRAARDRRGLTRKDLSDAAGVSPQTISNWEDGRTDPATTSLARLANFLGISMDYLSGRVEAIDGVTALPRGWVLVDAGKIQAILAAKTPEQLEPLVEWTPTILRWEFVIPQQFAIVPPDEYPDQVEQVREHLRRHHRDIAQVWVDRFDASRGNAQPWGRWLRSWWRREKS